MARGDVQQSPWTWQSLDYLGRAVRITVNFDNNTRALQSAVVGRDTGCLYNKIVFDRPDDGVRSKRLTAPTDGQGDRTYTANQISSQGLNTIEDVLAVQITAEP